MNVIAVDDERLVLREVEQELRSAIPDANIQTFLTAEGALDYARETIIDVAFLDIEIGTMTGLELAQKLKEFLPKINIVFCTGYSQYALESMKQYPSGYLMKPICKKDIEEQMNHLRNPIVSGTDKEYSIKTFAAFEVKHRGVEIKITRRASREILAYLVDSKGREVTFAELSDILFEEQPYGPLIRQKISVYVYELMKDLKSVGADNLVIRKKGAVRLNTDLVDCDYYRFLKGDVSAVNAYQNDYLPDYSWAEFTNGALYF